MKATERFLRACRRQPVDRPPVWIMRQAGRYMASYQAVRRRVSFMELCRSPQLVLDVTMMPLEQLDVDAAIVFSDILVPFEPLGMKVHFTGGPHLEPPIRDAATIGRMVADGAAAELGYVYEAIRLIRKEIGPDVPLLGFAGAPLTLASYAIEGGSSKNLHELKRFAYAEPEALEQLLEILTTVVSEFLRGQIEAGCDAVQVFDSWGGTLDLANWRRFSQPYTSRIFRELEDTGVPRIHYVQNSAHLTEGLAELPCEVLSVDWRQPLSLTAAATGGAFALQGNMDPGVLRAPASVIRRHVEANMASYGTGPGHIMNLGHGITPDATVDAARAMVDAVKELGPAFGGSVSA